MLIKRATLLIFLATFFLASTVKADDPSAEWIKFFRGEWSRKIEITTKKKDGKEEKEEFTAKWRGEIQAGGKALISKGKDSKGRSFVGMLGIQKGRLFEYGTDNEGYWTLSMNDIKKGRGQLKGALYDGAQGKGKLVMEKTKTGYITIWSFELANGDVMKGVEKNTRIK